MSLTDIEKLLKNRPQPPVENAAPKGFEKPYIQVGNDKLEMVTAPEEVDPNNPVEATLDDARAILKRYKLNPDAWELVTFGKSSWQKSEDSWLESWKLTAKPSNRKFGVELPTLDSVVNSMAKVKRKKLPKNFEPSKTVVCNIADPQIGKTDWKGGTKEFLIRNRDSMDRFVDYVMEAKPEEIVLGDLGDAFEGIENTAQQAFTNDLSLIDQMDVWAQIFFEWIEVCAQLAPKVAVISVPSNHTALRRGKDYIGRPCDDYGLLIHRLLARQAGMLPEKYGHVGFFAPSEYEESLTYTTLDGVGLGYVHGHQFRQVHLADDWWAGQTHGDCPLSAAKVLNYGHHHHLVMAEGRGGKFLFGSTSGDGGSAWIRNIKGVDSKAGVLAYSVDAYGPHSWKIC